MGYINTNTFIAFDFETTGFSGEYDHITEIGAVKVINGIITERFSELVNPLRSIPQMVTNITGITDQMVAGKEHIAFVMPRFLEFVSSLPMVAHNAAFDSKFLIRDCTLCGIKTKSDIIDTLSIARKKLPHLKSKKLCVLTEHFGIELSNAHRAWCDAEATTKLYMILKDL